MHDVARAAGVHQTTVSRALRDDQRLPKATRKKIQDIARALGYRANALASALVAARRERRAAAYEPTIAFVVRRDRESLGPDRHLRATRREYRLGAASAADVQGFRVESFVVGAAGLSERRLDTVLATRNVHGLILAPLLEPQGHFSLAWERYCTVAIEYTFTRPAFDRVVHDSYDGMRVIMGQCRRRGLTRVGLVLTRAGHERTAGTNAAAYWLEQKSGDFFAAIPPLILPAWHEQSFVGWTLDNRPEVIVTSNELSPRIHEWAGAGARRLGGELSLINVNAFPGTGEAGVFQDPHSIGATAARMVIEKMLHNDMGVPRHRRTVLTTGIWMEGSTLRSAIEVASAVCA